jgi:2-keto-4-pentenoate hydratase/2-oxohepta-3-ene-1,7-dioic acid hydratase in catechol pathway
MKFVSYVRCGEIGFGALRDDGIVDLTNLGNRGISRLQVALQVGALPTGDDIAARSADFTLSDISLLPVIPNPGKILCVGLNYESHRAETKRPDAKYPTIFTRYADSQVAHGQPIIRPRVSDQLDYEGELAVIIGKGGRNIQESDAMAHVAGYACYNDATVRDWQRHTHQFTPGKTFPGTGGFGPAMVTADEIADYTQLRIQTRLNEETVQDSTLSKLIFPIPSLIAYCSAFTPLRPGDVIVTGTPGGVGDRRDPPLYMKPGDLVEVEIDSVGLLANPITDEA